MVNIIFIVGLTGVGKSTTLETLQKSTNFTLLPNRRKLTDEIIIPEMQHKKNLPLELVRDRIKRFEFTKSYREIYPSGMAYVLKAYLENIEIPKGTLVFDNLRGIDEVKGGIQYFPNSRFIMLDAPEKVRLQRLVGREDVFDQVDGKLEIKNMPDLQGLQGVDFDGVARAIKIIQSEKENYDSVATAAYLKNELDNNRLLYLDTSKRAIPEVTKSILDWLNHS